MSKLSEVSKWASNDLSPVFSQWKQATLHYHWSCRNSQPFRQHGENNRVYGRKYVSRKGVQWSDWLNPQDQSIPNSTAKENDLQLGSDFISGTTSKFLSADPNEPVCINWWGMTGNQEEFKYFLPNIVYKSSNILYGILLYRRIRYKGGNSITTEEVSRFQCLFPNLNWLVWKSILPSKSCSNINGWITGCWQFFPLSGGVKSCKVSPEAVYPGANIWP